MFVHPRPQQVAWVGRSHHSESEKTVNNTLGQQLSKWKLAAGVLTVLMGAIVLAWPGLTIVVASTLFGVYLLVTGLVELFVAFTLPWSAATRVMLFISGALSLVLAILSFRHFGDAYAVLLLSLWIGISFIFQGISGAAFGISEGRCRDAAAIRCFVLRIGSKSSNPRRDCRLAAGCSHHECGRYRDL